jgi:hypothetical protein
MAAAVVNLVGEAASSENLPGDQAQELMQQVGAILEGMGYPVGNEMRRDFRLGGQSRWVRFTLERRDDGNQCLVRVHSIT